MTRKTPRVKTMHPIVDPDQTMSPAKQSASRTMNARPPSTNKESAGSSEQTKPHQTVAQRWHRKTAETNNLNTRTSRDSTNGAE